MDYENVNFQLFRIIGGVLERTLFSLELLFFSFSFRSPSRVSEATDRNRAESTENPGSVRLGSARVLREDVKIAWNFVYHPERAEDGRVHVGSRRNSEISYIPEDCVSLLKHDRSNRRLVVVVSW